jgi:undecaprenyl-diphosphatase
VLGIVFAVEAHLVAAIFVGVLDAGLGLFYLAGTTLDPRLRPPVHILQLGWCPTTASVGPHRHGAGIALALAALLWAYTRVPAALLVVLVAIPVWTMLARLYVGAHHVSDVLTEFVLASLWIWAAPACCYPRAQRRRTHRDPCGRTTPA